MVARVLLCSCEGVLSVAMQLLGCCESNTLHMGSRWLLVCC